MSYGVLILGNYHEAVLHVFSSYHLSNDWNSSPLDICHKAIDVNKDQLEFLQDRAVIIV